MNFDSKMTKFEFLLTNHCQMKTLRLLHLQLWWEQQERWPRKSTSIHQSAFDLGSGWTLKGTVVGLSPRQKTKCRADEELHSPLSKTRRKKCYFWSRNRHFDTFFDVNDRIWPKLTIWSSKIISALAAKVINVVIIHRFIAWCDCRRPPFSPSLVIWESFIIRLEINAAPCRRAPKTHY